MSSTVQEFEAKKSQKGLKKYFSLSDLTMSAQVLVMSLTLGPQEIVRPLVMMTMMARVILLSAVRYSSSGIRSEDEEEIVVESMEVNYPE